jgi:hypothetical protein
LTKFEIIIDIGCRTLVIFIRSTTNKEYRMTSSTSLQRYSYSVLQELKATYQSLTVLFKETYDDAHDHYGVLVDQSSWDAHKQYAASLAELGQVITSVEEAGKLL